MDTYKYFKKKILFLVFFIGCSMILFSNIKIANARTNAFIACLIDDEAYMYKTQVIYSGQEIEFGRISKLIPFSSASSSKSANKTNNTDDTGINLTVDNLGIPMDLSKYSGENTYGIFKMATSGEGEFTSVKYDIDEKGKIKITAVFKDKNDKLLSMDGREIPSYIWAKNYNIAAFETGANTSGPAVNQETQQDEPSTGLGDLTNAARSKVPSPLTFPTNQNETASEADINRAYNVADLLGENFRDALLYINDGKSYESVDELVETAYKLVQVGNGGVIENANGTKYSIIYNTYEDNYVGKCTIQRYTQQFKKDGADIVDKERTFVYAVKKGYKNSKAEDKFEDGTKNNLSSLKTSAGDTTYITWQHLFLEAGIFYAEGVSYSNQADLYEIGTFEKSMVETFRNFLSGIQNKLQLYSIEDCIFNSAIRGSQAFCYGVYQLNFNNAVWKAFMSMLALALSFTSIAVISIVLKKQWSLASPVSRYSMMNGIKDIIMATFIMASLWGLMRFAFYVNYRFVGIWTAYIGDKTMTGSGGYNSLSAILYAFVFFIIRTYVNIIYILRGLIVPVLMIISPLCIFVFCFGNVGKKVSATWMKEFLGNVFIQSFHALAFGFILKNSNGLRGIEALCVYASIIPLTSVIRQITGLGGGELLKKGSQLTSAVGSTIGAGVQAGASIEASRVMANAQERAASQQMAGSIIGGALGGGLSFVSPGLGMAASSLASGIGASKAAKTIAEGTKQAGSITAAGGMFNAGMGMAMNTVLDSGDGGATQSGIRAVERGESMKEEARGQQAQATAQATSGAINGMIKGAAMGYRSKQMQNGMGKENSYINNGEYKNRVVSNYQGITGNGFINGKSEKYAKSSFSLSAPVQKYSMIDKTTGHLSNVEHMTFDNKAVKEKQEIVKDLVSKASHNGKFDYSKFSKLDELEGMSDYSKVALALKHSEKTDNAGMKASIVSTMGVSDVRMINDNVAVVHPEIKLTDAQKYEREVQVANQIKQRQQGQHK